LNASKSESHLDGDLVFVNRQRQVQLDGRVGLLLDPKSVESGKGRSLVGAFSCSQGGVLDHSQIT